MKPTKLKVLIFDDSDELSEINSRNITNSHKLIRWLVYTLHKLAFSGTFEIRLVE